ncbi:unnamed protein product [Toxocara canis]|uniref:DUF3490 domain-containing protein n=1 Tax=Toxocara canis TaxID=6265 RepID=A0A183UIR5_TOXCA|nr:unnamed protein product [Toxocara canis]
MLSAKGAPLDVKSAEHVAPAESEEAASSKEMSPAENGEEDALSADAMLENVIEKQAYNREAIAKLKLDKYPLYVEREWWKEGKRMTFWSTWRMLKDVKRRRRLAELGPDRMRLKALKENTILPQAIRDECAEQLHNMDRYSRPNLILNMCQFTGRQRGKIKPYRVNRHIFRVTAMKLLISLLFALFSATHGSSIYFAAVPSSVHLPKNAALSASQIPQLNKFLLGLSSEAPSTWTGTGDLFSRPKALAMVSVMGVKSLSLSPVKATYPLDGDMSNMDSVSETLKQTFDENFEWLEASSGKISGTKIGTLANDEKQRNVKARVAPLRGEIESIYKIADSVGFYSII